MIKDNNSIMGRFTNAKQTRLDVICMEMSLLIQVIDTGKRRTLIVNIRILTGDKRLA